MKLITSQYDASLEEWLDVVNLEDIYSRVYPDDRGTREGDAGLPQRRGDGF